MAKRQGPRQENQIAPRGIFVLRYDPLERFGNLVDIKFWNFWISEFQKNFRNPAQSSGSQGLGKHPDRLRAGMRAKLRFVVFLTKLVVAEMHVLLGFGR